MHELGIVFHIAESVEKIAKENGAAHINRVVLQIGEVSAVVGTYLEDCWNWNAKRSPILDGCKLEIEQIDAVTYCEDCAKTYPTVKFGKTCPYCGGGNTYLVQGNETIIKEIEVCDESENGENGDEKDNVNGANEKKETSEADDSKADI